MNRYDLERRLALVIARVRALASGGRVLEVGCGLGYLSARLVRERALSPDPRAPGLAINQLIVARAP